MCRFGQSWVAQIHAGDIARAFREAIQAIEDQRGQWRRRCCELLSTHAGNAFVIGLPERRGRERVHW